MSRRPAPSKQNNKQNFSKPSGFRPSSKPADFVEIPKTWRVIVGHHAIKEAFAVKPKSIRELWLKQGWESSQELREFEKLARDLGIKIQNKPLPFLDRLCATHQGAALLKDGHPQFEDPTGDFSTILMLDGIEDPHNLGAILRTSWLMKVDGLLIPEERAVGLTPTVHKVACGGVEHVPVANYVNFSVPVERLKEKGFWVFGLSHKAKKSIFDLKIPEKIVWAIGAEDKGLRVTTERLCDELVSIPQATDAASYNASVATAIALTETFRQHQSSKK
jgi:23S rRNA (guanosine2251-2'-O)-methyltransferase